MGIKLKHLSKLGVVGIALVLTASLMPLPIARATGAVNTTWNRPPELLSEPEGRVDVAEDTSTGKATITIGTLWIEIVDSLTINGTPYTTFPVGANQLLSHFSNQEIVFDTVVDIAPSYNLTINTHKITDQEMFIGNFLWENDENSPTAVEDDIIGHGTISFVKAVYGGNTYNSVAEVNAAGAGFSWNDSLGIAPTTGAATFPMGTVLTIKLIPEAGYQLTSFGINGGTFTPQENIGEYTFTIRGGNGHLGAKFEAVNNVVDAQSGAVAAGAIELGGNEDSMKVGTAKLEVEDIDVDNITVSNFKAAAAGYKISNYLNISLYNTVYKGSASASWDTEVTELDNNATITLKLEDRVDGNEIVIIHEKHDGTYEVIPTVYDPATNTITFKTSSFSNYAIASRTVAGSPDTGASANGASSANQSAILAISTAVILTFAIWFAHKQKWIK